MFSESYKWHYDYVSLAFDSGFSFEKHKVDDFDKNKICLIDIDRVVQERDIATIEKFIPCVTQFMLDTEQAQILDESFAKIFRVSQLSIEYLLFCKKYLDSALVRVKTEIAKLNEENKELSLFVEDLKEHVSVLMKELKEKNIATFKCVECHKVFSTEDFLNSHIKRRHNSFCPSREVETEKLHSEIKELKGRLNSAEQMIQKEQAQVKPTHEVENGFSRVNEFKKIDELQQKFEELRVQVQSELKILQTQNNFQEKYEKLIEQIALQTSKSQSKHDIQYPKTSRENTTQTELNIDQINFKKSPQEIEEEKVEVNIPKDNASDFKQTQQLIEIGGALETKLTTSLEKIESQMQSFWNKLNLMEIPKSKNHCEDSKENQMPRSVKAKSRYTLTAGENVQNINTAAESSSTKYDNSSRNSKKNHSQPLKPSKVKIHKKMDFINEVGSLSVLENENKSNAKNEQTLIAPLMNKMNSSQFSKKASTSSNVSLSDSESLSQLPEREIIKQPPKPTSLLTIPRKSLMVNEKLFEHFKEEVENIVINGRLQDLGVSPEWKGLPSGSFNRALEIVKHQANLMKKTFPDFDEIAVKIENEVAKKMQNISVKNKGLNRLIKEKHPKGETKKKYLGCLEDIPVTQIEIKNRKMYDTDSETEEINVVTSKIQENLREPTYSAVIEELKSVTTKIETYCDDKSITKLMVEEDNIGKREDQTKGVLKSNAPSMTSLTKKKVLFNLENNDVGSIANREGGSTTSIPSSVLDGTPRKIKEHSKKRHIREQKDIEDLSDFDFSDI